MLRAEIDYRVSAPHILLHLQYNYKYVNQISVQEEVQMVLEHFNANVEVKSDVL